MTALFLAAFLSADLTPVSVEVEGVRREALVSIPDSATKENPAPVVFAFHGHGGNMRNASRQFHIETVWPEAVVVYMQGLKTATLRDPKGERPGWQNLPGMQGDRDLKAFDAMLAHLKTRTTVDPSRIYAMGHSNGGGFTYCLWRARPEVFAAIAPSSANPPIPVDGMKPIPVLHVSGKTDAIVSFDGQTKTVEAVKKINGCSEPGKEWAKDCTEFASDKGTPLVWLVHEGDHRYLSAAPALIVRFFQEHSKSKDKTSAAAIKKMVGD